MMTSKLDAIRGKLDAWETANEAYHAHTDLENEDYATESTLLDAREMAERAITDYAIQDLRALPMERSPYLLAVVDAVRALAGD